VTLYSGPSSTCSLDTTVVAVSGFNPVTGLTSTSTTFTFASPVTNTYFCAVVKDSLGVKAPSLTSLLAVNQALSPPTIALTVPAIDSGQSATLYTVIPFNYGTPSYTCQWLQEPPGAISYSSLGGPLSSLGQPFPCLAGSYPSTPTGTLSTVGVWNFELEVKDGSSTPAIVFSNQVSLTVSTALTVGTPTATPSVIDAGQSLTLSDVFNGGTPTYTCQWLEELPGASVYSQASSSPCSSPQTSTVVTLSIAGTWHLELQVTDSSSLPSTATSGAVTVTVDSALSAGAVTPASPSLDSGQSITLASNPSGGTAPYFYQWYNGTGSSCSSLTTITGATAPDLTIRPTSTSETTVNYCYRVWDSLTATSPQYSPVDPVTEYPQLTAAAITSPLKSPPTIDSGQSVTLSAKPMGGTGAYSVQWYTGTSCSSGAITGATSSTYAASPTSTTTYYYKVTDTSQGTPTGACSPGYTVAVASALSATLKISPSVIDFLQTPTTTIAATVTLSGGVSPFDVTLYSGSSSSACSSDTVVTVTSGSSPNPDDGLTGSSVTFEFSSPASGVTYYCAAVQDSTGGPTVYAPPQKLTVNPTMALSAPVLSPSVLDTGQTVTVTASVSWSGGTAPYTVTLYSSPTSSCSSSSTEVAALGSNPQTGLSATSATFTFTSPSSEEYYCAVVTDSSTPPVTAPPSSPSELVLSPALTATAITASPTPVDSGQSSVLSTVTSFSGGTFPYTCQWLEEAPGASSYSSLGSSFSCTTSGTPSTSTGTLSTVGVWSFELQVKDSSGVPVTVQSIPVTVTVNTALSVTSFGLSPPYTETGVPTMVTATVYWVGGTGGYDVTLYSGGQPGVSNPACSSLTTEVASYFTSSTTYAFVFSSPTSDAFYCVQVTDSSTPQVTASSSSIEFSVNGPLDPHTTLSASCVRTAKDSWSCAATLKGFEGSVSGETVAWSQLSGKGEVSFTPTLCALSSGGTCSVNVTGVSPGRVLIQASYGGDTTDYNAASYGKAELSVIRARPSLQVSCSSRLMALDSAITCTAALKGYGGSVAGESVVLSQASGKGEVTFSDTVCTLSSAGTCTFTITGIRDGGVGIRAVYGRDALNTRSSARLSLKVK
jgi:hypothetical protein